MSTVCPPTLDPLSRISWQWIRTVRIIRNVPLLFWHSATSTNDKYEFLSSKRGKWSPSASVTTASTAAWIWVTTAHTGLSANSTTTYFYISLWCCRNDARQPVTFYISDIADARTSTSGSALCIFISFIRCILLAQRILKEDMLTRLWWTPSPRTFSNPNTIHDRVTSFVFVQYYNKHECTVDQEL